MLYEDRQAAIEAQIRPRPGQAEYLDMLRAVTALAANAGEQKKLLDIVAPFTLKKQSELEVLT